MGDTLSIKPDIFRTAMGRFVTGVTIITSADGKEKTGMTVNAITSLSLTPMQLLICLKRDSLTGECIKRSGRFVVNVLSREQSDLAWQFARPVSDRFAGVDHVLDANGTPVLAGVVAHVCCGLDRILDGGDHEIFIGTVDDCVSNECEPLVFHQGKMASVATA